jgi:hypothetical protein
MRVSLVLVSCCAGLAPGQTPMSRGPALGVPAVVGVRNPALNQPDVLLFKRPGYQNLPAAPIATPLPGPGAPLVTAEALHLKDVNSWELHAPGLRPAARAGGTAAFHVTRGRCVLFGGASPALLGDTWEWDGTNWSQPGPGNSPSARAFSATAYDSARQRVVLFGGTTGGGSVNDTWEWDGTAWLQRAPATSPPARRDHALAFDSARGRTVLFGGHAGSPGSPLGDTWEWDGTQWQQKLPALAPAPRSGHALAYDALRGRVVLFGGRDSALTSMGDTWEWDGTSWVQPTVTGAPAARHGHGLAYHSAQQRVLLCGGILQTGGVCDLWEFDGSLWRRRHPCMAPGARRAHAFTYDSLRGRPVLFGGIRDLSGTFWYGDTWTWTSTPNAIAINDISIGQDFLPTLGNAINVPAQSWVGVAYSVTSTTTGGTGAVGAEVAGANGVGGDIFNYVLGTSDPYCLPPVEIGLITKAVDSDEGTVSGGADVNSVDLFLPAYNMDPSFFLTPPSTTPTIYFTVRGASLVHVPTIWWEGSVPSGATVLRTTWDPVAGVWSCPTVLIRYSDIAVGPAQFLESEEIDALAIDAARGQMVFSTRRIRNDSGPTAAPSQLMLMAVAADMPNASVLQYPNSYMGGVPVANEMDLGLSGDVDGVCIYDPCNRTTPGRDLFERILGERNLSVLPTPGVRIENAAWRDSNAAGKVLTTATAGGPRPAVSFLLLTDVVTFPFAIYYQTAFPAAQGGFPGSPVTATFPLPNAPLAGTIGIHWVDVDPVQLTLHLGPALLFRF